MKNSYLKKAVISFALFAFCATIIAFTEIPNPAIKNVVAYLESTANVTQATSISTRVTANAQNGVITTVSSTLAAQSDAEFWVRNNKCSANSQVKVCPVYNDTLSGYPYVFLSQISEDSFKVRIFNADTSDALNGVIRIVYEVSN